MEIRNEESKQSSYGDQKANNNQFNMKEKKKKIDTIKFQSLLYR
jgi:hypothetical protein